MSRDRFDVLERFAPLFEAPEASFEGFLVRRDRRRRNQRIAAGIVGFGVFVAAVLFVTSWQRDERAPTPGGSRDRETTARVPAIGTLTLTDSTCEMEPIAGAIEPGVVAFRVTNGSADRAAFDLVRFVPDRLSYEELAAHVERQWRRAEAGKPIGRTGNEAFGTLGLPRFSGPVVHEQVLAGHSARIAGLVRPGSYAFVCYRALDGPMDFRPFATVGPIRVQ